MKVRCFNGSGMVSEKAVVVAVARKNHVTPFGDIITPERDSFMGNRGVLHDDEGCIQRAWQFSGGSSACWSSGAASAG